MKSVDYELVIIGGGPAGLTAGLYAARGGLNVILIEKIVPGGQIIITDWIENYPGFPKGAIWQGLISNEGKGLNQLKRVTLKLPGHEIYYMYDDQGKFHGYSWPKLSITLERI